MLKDKKKTLPFIPLEVQDRIQTIIKSYYVMFMTYN